MVYSCVHFGYMCHTFLQTLPLATSLLATIRNFTLYERLIFQKNHECLISNSVYPFFPVQQRNESFHRFEARPIDCVLASTIVFNKNPLDKCQFVQLYLFDCCRACNAKYAKCMAQLGALNGGPEYCYRDSYKCMCECMDHHPPADIRPFRSSWFTNSCDELCMCNDHCTLLIWRRNCIDIVYFVCFCIVNFC